MKKELSVPPSEDVLWQVTSKVDSRMSVRVRARTAWQAHIETKLGCYSDVVCEQVSETSTVRTDGYGNADPNGKFRSPKRPTNGNGHANGSGGLFGKIR